MVAYGEKYEESTSELNKRKEEEEIKNQHPKVKSITEIEKT